MVAAKPLEIALRVHNAHRSHRLAVDKILLAVSVPAEKWFDHLELAPVFLVASNMMPPGLDISCDSIRHPHPHFGNRPGGFSRPIGRHAFRCKLVPAA